MFHTAGTRLRLHKPISSTATSLFFSQNYYSKIRARDRKEEIERKRYDALNVDQFVKELSASIENNDLVELEEKLIFFNRILPQEVASTDVVETLNLCLELGTDQIKILSLKCLAKIAFGNQDLIDDKHYIKLFNSDCIEILKALLDLYTHISKKHLNKNVLKNLISVSESLGYDYLDFFKNLANFLSSALADPDFESKSLLIKLNGEIYRILGVIPDSTHYYGDGDKAVNLDCIIDMLHWIYLGCNDVESMVNLGFKFINLSNQNQDILLPIYLIIGKAIHSDSNYQLHESLVTNLSLSLKSPKRRIKLASLILVTTMAGKNLSTAEFVLPLSQTIIEILESKDTYDIRLESAIYVMHMMFGHKNEFISNFIKIEPRISRAMLDLLDSCKQDYTTVWLCLDYLEWCLANEECVRRLYDLRAIEIMESVQFLHNEEVDRRVSELTMHFDMLDL